MDLREFTKISLNTNRNLIVERYIDDSEETEFIEVFPIFYKLGRLVCSECKTGKNIILNIKKIKNVQPGRLEYREYYEFSIL